MKEITPEDKALEIYKKLRTQIIDAKEEGLNDETANTCALICVKYIQEELDHYMTNKPTTEIRPFDLSGKQFWEKVYEFLKIFRLN